MKSRPGEQDIEAAAIEIGESFAAMYLLFHRRRPKRGMRPDGQMLAVLNHLALAGPLTVTEAARHMDRAQSAMSDVLDRLVRRGLVERVSDARDRRRTLVWLTPAGDATLASEREVLSRDLVRAALTRTAPAHRRALVRGVRALLRAGREMSNDRARSARKGGTR